MTVVDVHLFNIVLCALLKELSRDSSHVPELATVEEPKVSILFIPAFIFQLLKCLHYHLELFCYLCVTFQTVCTVFIC